MKSSALSCAVKLTPQMVQRGIDNLPKEEQHRVAACKKQMRHLLSEFGDAGKYALAHLNAELQADKEE